VNDEKDFQKTYNINIIDSSRRCHVYRRQKYDFFSDPQDKNIFERTVCDIEAEPLLTVTIPKSKFEKLIHVHKIFFNHREVSNSDIFSTILDQAHEEKSLRHKHPALQEAYANYSLLLHLTGHQKKIDLD
jgi:hypothetical protein